MIITRGVGGRGYKFEKIWFRHNISFFTKAKVDKQNFKSELQSRFKNTLSQNTNLFGFKHLNGLIQFLDQMEQ